MKHLLSTLFILVSLSSFGQTFKKDLKPFTELKVTRGIQATLVYSTDAELSFDVRGLSKSDIIIEQDHGRLYIKVRTKGLWELMEENKWWVKVSIPYQKLESIEITTGAVIKADNVIELDHLLIENKMGAEVELELKVVKLKVDTSMGSISRLSGLAKNVDIDASMGAEVHAYGLKSKYSTVESSMGAVVSVSCDYEFDGSASMGGEIEVRGNPEKAFKSETMGGWISVY